MGAKQQDLTGRKFGLLTVEKMGESRQYGKCKKRTWVCACECGNTTIVLTGNLTKTSGTKSCGCLLAKHSAENGRKSRAKLANPESPSNSVLAQYRVSARKRGLEFSLTERQFKALITSPCFYCGKEGSNFARKRFFSLRYNGVDRRDNSIGYTEGNSVPCCTTCNHAKHTLEATDFMEWVKRVYEHSFRRGQAPLVAQQEAPK